MGMLGFQWQKYKIKSGVTVFLHVKVSGLLFFAFHSIVVD